MHIGECVLKLIRMWEKSDGGYVQDVINKIVSSSVTVVNKEFDQWNAC